MQGQLRIRLQKSSHRNEESSLSHLPYTAPVELTPDLPDTTDIVSPVPNLLPPDNNEEECRTLFPMLFLVDRCASPPPSAVE